MTPEKVVATEERSARWHLIASGVLAVVTGATGLITRDPLLTAIPGLLTAAGLIKTAGKSSVIVTYCIRKVTKYYD